MKVELIPYTLIDGIPTFRDSEIMGLYDRMVADGTAETVFSDGVITDATKFFQAMRWEANRLFIIHVDGEKSGVIWLNRFEARFARCHWCLFSNRWGKDSVTIGKEVLRIIMEVSPYDMLMGIVPSYNEIAIRYCERCGGIIQGEIPCASLKKGKSVKGTVVYYGGISHENTDRDRD